MTQTVLHSSRGAVISDVVTPIVMATCTINCFSLTDVCGGKPTKYSEQDWTPYVGKKVIIEGEGFTQWLVAASDPCAGTLEYISLSSLGTPLYLNDGSQTDINGNVIGLNGVPYSSFDRISYTPLRLIYNVALTFDGSCLLTPIVCTSKLILTWRGSNSSNNNFWEYNGSLCSTIAGNSFMKLDLFYDTCDYHWRVEGGVVLETILAGLTPEGNYPDIACATNFYGLKNTVVA